MKFDEIQKRLDDLSSELKLEALPTPIYTYNVVQELSLLLRETVMVTARMMRELAEVQSLHNTVLEEHSRLLVRLDEWKKIQEEKRDA